MTEIYVSVDVEANGPIPGPNSMLSFGAAAFAIEPGLLQGKPSIFTRNLTELPGSEGDPDTMAWWGREENKNAWEACRQNQVDPHVAMKEFVAWVKGLGGKPVCVAYPAGYDFMWIYWYLRRFAGDSPFSFSCLDIKTFACAVLKTPFRETTKKNMPREWFHGLPKHTHVASDDAIEQGLLFLNMLRHSRRSHSL
jgi:hypothetical protein